MALFEHIQILKRFDVLIRLENTGTANEIAKLLEISRRTVFTYIEELESFGAEIAYNKISKTFYYTQKFTLKF
jgi:predicted DNA-binding transcriptional regulator YafY